MRPFLISLFALSAVISTAQKLPAIDKSPADIAYYKESREPVLRVVYGRPSANGREVFGKQVKYDKVWRTGANECSVLEVFKTVSIGGKTVEPGRYGLFTVPGENEWQLILNSDADQWGAFFYKEKNDVLRSTANSENSKDFIETFTIVFDKTKTGADLVLAWENTIVKFPVEYPDNNK